MPLVVSAEPPAVGEVVQAARWDGRVEHGVIEEAGEKRYRVVFSDGEETWLPADQVKAQPANPFLDAPPSCQREE